MKTDRLEPEFVDLIPTEVREGVLYVSMEYATTVHLCPSGCGNKVVLPLSPAEWRLTYDGEAITLSPSVGNWQYPCRSHYWVRGNQIITAKPWTERQIEQGRQRDERDLREHLNRRASAQSGTDDGATGTIGRWVRRVLGRWTS